MALLTWKLAEVGRFIQLSICRVCLGWNSFLVCRGSWNFQLPTWKLARDGQKSAESVGEAAGPIQLSICTVCQMSNKTICLSLTSVFIQTISLSSLASSVCMRKYFPGLPQLKHTLLKVSSEERWRVIRVFHLHELLCQFGCKKSEVFFYFFFTSQGC